MSTPLHCYFVAPIALFIKVYLRSDTGYLTKTMSFCYTALMVFIIAFSATWFLVEPAGALSTLADAMVELIERYLWLMTSAFLLGKLSSTWKDVQHAEAENSVLRQDQKAYKIKVETAQATIRQNESRDAERTLLLTDQGNIILTLSRKLKIARNELMLLGARWDDLVIRNFNLEGEVQRLYRVEDHLGMAQKLLSQQRRTAKGPPTFSKSIQADDHHRERQPPAVASNMTQTIRTSTTSAGIQTISETTGLLKPKKRTFTLHDYVICGESVMSGANVCPVAGRGHITANDGGRYIRTNSSRASSRASSTSTNSSTSSSVATLAPASFSLGGSSGGGNSIRLTGASSVTGDSVPTPKPPKQANEAKRRKTKQANKGAKKNKAAGFFDPRRVPTGYADAKAAGDAAKAVSDAAKGF